MDYLTAEFRVTRPESYTTPTCPGHTSTSARQGHYYRTNFVYEAIRLAAWDFVNDLVFDVEQVHPGPRTFVGRFTRKGRLLSSTIGIADSTGHVLSTAIDEFV